MEPFLPEEQIEAESLRLRNTLGVTDQFVPDLIEILSFKLARLYSGFRLIIVPDNDLPDAYAEANVGQNTITLRQSVYDDAYNYGSHARMTIAHEIAHLVLQHQGVHQRTDSFVDLRPEFQAKRFAAYFLMPSHLLRKFRSAEKVEGAFQVSAEAAEIRLKEFKEQRNKVRRIARAWLALVLPRHERLVGTVESLLDKALREEGLRNFSLEKRVKTLQSAMKKISKKAYQNPLTELTDLSGLRIVVLSADFVEQAGDVIRALFDVDKGNSGERSPERGTSHMGYRASHFLCSLGTRREALPEYRGFAGLKFEIQVRTLAEHLLAEATHNSAYKMDGDVPDELIKRINTWSANIAQFDADIRELANRLRESGSTKE
jgi:ppGpp synthetase/RelA/SpoT-type nucleotidyltranferase